MDDQQTGIDGDQTQWLRVDTAESLPADGRSPRRRVGIGVVALAAVVALITGAAGAVLVTSGGDSTDETATQTTTTIVTPGAVNANGHMAPRWLPDGFMLQTADEGNLSGPPCQQGTFAGAAPTASASGAVQVGPGVCATPISYLRYISDQMLVGSEPPPMITFIQAGAGDIRSPATTTPVSVRGKPGLLYRSGATVWLAWTENAETTFFVTATGLSVDDVMRVAESVEGLDADAWAALVSTARSSEASNGPPGRDELVACLRARGLEVPDPPTGPMSVTVSPQYPPDAAQAAWQACRDTFARSNGMPTNQLAQILAVPDCMAAQGWLIVVMSGPPADGVAYSTAMQKCQPIGPIGGPPGRVELVACLRAQGLEVPDPPTGPSSVTVSLHYPPAAAQAAWQACRDTYARTSGMPTNQLTQILAVPDCMAAQGWLIVVMSGPPADGVAYSTAMQNCQPFTGPPWRPQLVACLRAQGLEVPEGPTGPTSVTVSRQYAPEAAQAAWQACRDAFIKASGIPPQPLSTYDCMAGHGWIVAVMSGPPADGVAYSSAMQSCGPPRS